MTVLSPYLPRDVAEKFSADPARWLLKARSPLVKFRAAVDLLDWPREAEEPQAWWVRRFEDPVLAAIARGQAEDGLWYAREPFFRRRPSLYVPRYLATLWQLPVLADLGCTVEGEPAARAAEAMRRRRTAEGFFDLGPGGPFIRGNGWVVSSLASLGADASLINPGREWLRGRQRADGGWADAFEVEGEEAPSTVATTAAVLRALGPGEGGAAEGRRFLLARLFTDYNGRFPPSAKAWRRLGWPPYNFDALSLGISLAGAGASREEVAPLARVVRGLQTRRGFWRQQVPIPERCWFDPVRAGRASRWVTFWAASFLKWFYGGEEAERHCEVSRFRL